MKNKKNNKRYKYGVGGFIDPLHTDLITGKKPNQIVSPNETLAQNNINVANAKYKAFDNNFTKGLDLFGNLAIQIGSAIMGKGGGGFLGDLLKTGVNTVSGLAQNQGRTYAAGGTVPVEVEGEEVLETPYGNILELTGNSHEQGGINLDVPAGTEIYSKRVKGSDGKTMAQRKLYREKQLRRLEKLYKNNPSNKMIKRAYEKSKADFELIEQNDLAEMQALNEAINNKSEQEFATGGYAFLDWKDKNDPEKLKEVYIQDQFNSVLSPAYSGTATGISKPAVSNILSDFNTIPVNFTGSNGNVSNTVGNKSLKGQPVDVDNSNKKFNWENFGKTFTNSVLGQATPGDILGIAGQIYGYDRMMKNTLEQRAGDTPNINHYKDFGKKGLETIQSNKQYINQIRDNMLKDLDTSITALKSSNRNSARGINTLRALDIASELGANKQRNEIYNQFLNAMSSLYSQEANQHNIMDNIIMQGEAQRDLADKQDRDNFYSNFSQNIASKSAGLQNIAKNINKIQERKTKETALNSLANDYNINSLTGETKRKAVEMQEKNPLFFDSIPTEIRKDFMKKLIKHNLTILGNKVIDKNGKEYSISEINKLSAE